jgi:putative PIN family toxin of toxin-antitoxin system
MRVLVDTNVLATGWVGGPLGLQTPPAQIWRLWKQGQFELLVSAHVLNELRDTLERPWFAAKTTHQERSGLLADILLLGTEVSITGEIQKITSHWQDDLVLAAAVSGSADYLVTGDAEFRRVDQYEGVKIRTPAEFLQELESPAG